MELPFSPTKDLNLIQRNIKNPKNIIVKSKRYLFVQSANDIKLIQEKLNEEGVYKENISRVNFQKGDTLTIKDGRFIGIDAIFLSDKSKDRVRLLLKLLNTTVISEVNKSDIGHKEVVKDFKF